MRRAKPTLTGQELEIMKIVWDRSQVTVRDVYEAMRERRQIAYTTVMTMMNILEQKGHLSKARDQKAFVYKAVQPGQDVIRGMVREFLGRVFDGSARPLLVHLVEDKTLTREDLEQIARLLEKSE